MLGFGKSRQVSSITALDMERIVPGASPLKAIEKLPGVNFQSADAFGNYEWAVRISLRGFNQNQLGFTLDGVPLGDMSYGVTNGLHISRAIISENIGRTEVAQGAGALGTASTSNLGGTIQFYSDSPKDKMNVTGSGTYGSNNTYRGYARIEFRADRRHRQRLSQLRLLQHRQVEGLWHAAPAAGERQGHGRSRPAGRHLRLFRLFRSS